MLNPSSLFLACLITLAANPSLVATIPLPPSPHSSSTSVRHRSFKATRSLPVLRIVDDEQYLEPALWTSAFTDDSILPESIFADEDEASLNAILASVHQPHTERAISKPVVKRSHSSGKASHQNVKRAVSRKEPMWEIRASSRISRFRATATNKPVATSAAVAQPTSSIVWTKVQTTSRSLPTPSSIALPSAAPIVVPTSTAMNAPSATPTLSGTHEGEGTWYAPGLGACGNDATNDSPIVAVSHLLYDSFPGHTTNPNLNPICGQKIRATYKGKTVDVTVQDRCTGCAWGDLDFSPSIFSQLADLDIGRLKGVEWTFL
ncbi:hypothetical protein JCM5353_007436 [Sporobolomyces roseus]